ncbi:MAG: hypothetical protein V8T10_07375 [Merdibacter sp.]
MRWYDLSAHHDAHHPASGSPRTAFPPLSNSLIGLLKEYVAGEQHHHHEMLMSAQRIAARTYDSFALYCEVALIYLLFCTILTKVQRICEKKLELN